MFLDGRKPVHPLVVGEGFVVVGDDARSGRFSLFPDGMEPEVTIQQHMSTRGIRFCHRKRLDYSYFLDGDRDPRILP